MSASVKALAVMDELIADQGYMSPDHAARCREARAAVAELIAAGTRLSKTAGVNDADWERFDAALVRVGGAS